jgi:ATP-dependent Clp protease protease subunit
MMAIYDTMRFVISDIRTVCLGQAASAAALILAAGTRGKRMMLPHARVVVHQPETDSNQLLQATDLHIQAREVQRMRRVMEEILTEHTGLSPERVRNALERETILDGPDAIAFGFVDEMLPVRGT